MIFSIKRKNNTGSCSVVAGHLEFMILLSQNPKCQGSEVNHLMAFRFITVFLPLFLPICVLETEPRVLCMLGLTRCSFDNWRSNKNLKFDMTSNPMTCLHLAFLLSSMASLYQLSSHKDKEIFLNSNENSDFLAKPSDGFPVTQSKT